MRLHIDVEKQLTAFRLQVQLDVGTEILVLFGPSGAGKTTVLNLVAGLATPEAGEIALDGTVFFRRHRPGPPVNLPARKRRIGYVFQQYALFPHLTALGNVAYPLWRQRDGRARALALLDRMRLAHLADRYPHELSGGQQQRVAIARALANDPLILLADEPTGNLDEWSARGIFELFREINAAGTAVLMATHNLELVRAHPQYRVIELNQGEIVYDSAAPLGTHDAADADVLRHS